MALKRGAWHGLIALALLQPGASHAAAETAAPSVVAAQIDNGPQAQSGLSENAQLERIFADEMRQGFALDPVGALQQGQRVSVEAFLQLFSPELAKARREANAQVLARLRQINPGKLDEPHRLSREVLIDAKSADAALLQPDLLALTEVRPFNHFGGFHVSYP